MEDEKETEKVDEYEKDTQVEESGRFIRLSSCRLTSDIQKFKEQSLVHGRRIYCLTVPSVRAQGQRAKKSL